MLETLVGRYKTNQLHIQNCCESWCKPWFKQLKRTFYRNNGRKDASNNLYNWQATASAQVMHEDAGPESWAMSDAVTSRSDIGRKFGGITYSKGASVIRMMEGILGRDTLLQGLSSYLAAQAYGNSVEEQLFLHLEEAGSLAGSWPQEGVDSFEETMKTWTNKVLGRSVELLVVGVDLSRLYAELRVSAASHL